MVGNRKSRWLRYSIAAAVVLVLCLLLLWPSSELVDSARVDRGPVAETVDAEGRTRVRDRYVITAPIAAFARRLAFEPGDPVKAGQALVELDASAAPSLDARARAEARAQVGAAEARLAAAREQARAAEAVAVHAEAEAKRLQALLDQHLVAASAAEQARSEDLRSRREAASARFQAAMAEHELQAARAVLEVGSQSTADSNALVLKSPISGVVLRRFFESARPVQAGDSLLEIGDPRALEVEVDVLSADAVRLRPGMPVRLLRWGQPEPLAARVQRIEPGGFTKISALGVEEQRVWVIVDISSPAAEWSRLGDAYRVNARFVLRSTDAALRVPASAVFAVDGKDTVFRIVGGHARATPVRLGIQGGGFAEVLDGLAAQDLVIVHPDRALADGDRVRAR